MFLHDDEFDFYPRELNGAAGLAIDLMGGPDGRGSGGTVSGAFSFSESLASGSDVNAHVLVLTGISDAFHLDIDII